MFLYFVIFAVCCVFLCVNVLVGILVQHMLQFGSLSELFNQTKNTSEQSSDVPDKDETIDSVHYYTNIINLILI